MEEQANKYWNYYIPEVQNNLNRGVKKYKSIIAKLLYSYLFDGSIIISDDIINILQLREAAIKNEVFRFLIKEKQIIIASSLDENGNEIPLQQRALTVAQNNSMNPIFDKERFLDFTDLNFLQTHAEKVFYPRPRKYTDYNDKVWSFYKNFQHFDLIPQDIYKIIFDELHKKQVYGELIFPPFFQRPKNENSLASILRKKTGDEDIWDKYGDSIFKISSAFECSFLSDYLATDITYSEFVSRGMEIIKGRYSFEKQPILEAVTVHSLFDPPTFAEGLLMLNEKDIISLVESDESKYYKKQIRSFGSSYSGISDIQRTLADYIKLINERIKIKVGLSVKRESEIKILPYEFSRRNPLLTKTVDFFGVTLLDNFTSGVFSLGNFLVDLIFHKKENINQQNDETKEENFMELMRSDEDKTIERIDQKAILQTDKTKETVVSATKLIY